ncbi:MAG: hypothetical protein M3250_04265, partial [Thermoproteota archaeon]|nr:hypothetical protein [Thermoproteota archaeon]
MTDLTGLCTFDDHFDLLFTILHLEAFYRSLFYNNVYQRSNSRIAPRQMKWPGGNFSFFVRIHNGKNRLVNPPLSFEKKDTYS